MRLVIDACCWSNRRGFGRFTRELLTALVPMADHEGHEVFLVADRETVAAGGFPSAARIKEVATTEQPTRAAANDGARSPADLLRLGLAVARLCPQAILFPAVYSYFPLLWRAPTVVVFHDAIAEQFPELIFPYLYTRFLWKIKTRLALAQADRVVTVTRAARLQIHDAFGISEKEITVIPEGPAKEFELLSDEIKGLAVDFRRQWGIPVEPSLLLYVGGLGPHKNLQGLFRAFSRLGEGAHLVIVGDTENEVFLSCHRELEELAKDLHIGHRVTFTGYVSNLDLARLMNFATALVLPSFSEGFGLPVVEAMACGLPVAVSRAGSLPEVVGDAGVFFDPHDLDDMARVLGELLAFPDRRRALRRKGFVRLGKYSWQAAARQMLAVLEEVGA